LHERISFNLGKRSNERERSCLKPLESNLSFCSQGYNERGLKAFVQLLKSRSLQPGNPIFRANKKTGVRGKEEAEGRIKVRISPRGV